MKRIEILAPAGNVPALEAAVFSGADAVYLGGSWFSARAMAGNFTDEELEDALRFAHARGVKCYIAVNTLLKDEELPEALRFLSFLCSLSADGILVQDMGLFRLAAELCPQMPLHCSTQMSLFTPADVRLMKEMGARRVVLARELSLAEIREIHESVDMELEAFVHGALCMSVSGQCYFSAMLGSRSGNRGRCAQTCRLPFWAGDTPNALSLKDMSFMEEIADLEKAGVCSAKIEGRMKRPEYVAAAVSAGRAAVDTGGVSPELLENLAAVFSRSGFTKGYLLGTRGKEMFGVRSKEDVVSGTAALFARLHSLYKNEYQRVPLFIKAELQEGQLLKLEMRDDCGNFSTLVGEEPAQRALNKPLSQQRLGEQLCKLGGTPYYAAEWDCHTDGVSILPMSALNALRRKGVEEITAKREARSPVPMKSYVSSGEKRQTGALELRASFRSVGQIPPDISPLTWVYLPLGTPPEVLLQVQARGVRVGVEIPRAIFGLETFVGEEISALLAAGVDTFLCSTLGAVALCREKGAKIHGGFSLNITNTEALKTFAQLGLSCAELSFELTLQEISRMGGTLPRGLMIYGRQALMLVRNCPLAGDGCRHCTKPGCLTDRMGVEFPVMCPLFLKKAENGGDSQNSAEIFNSVPLSLSDRIHEINGVDFGVLRFTVEKDVECARVLAGFVRRETPQYNYTRGLFYRGVL